MPRNDVRRSSWRRTLLMRCCVDRRQCRGNRFRTQSRTAQLRPHLLRRQYGPPAIGITIMKARLGRIALLDARFARRSIQTKTFAGVQCEVDVKNRYSTYQIADAANEGGAPNSARARSSMSSSSSTTRSSSDSITIMKSRSSRTVSGRSSQNPSNTLSKVSGISVRSPMNGGHTRTGLPQIAGPEVSDPGRGSWPGVRMGDRLARAPSLRPSLRCSY
jgi:hypothetical protein